MNKIRKYEGGGKEGPGGDKYLDRMASTFSPLVPSVSYMDHLYKR